jgi:hypothetical protein
MVTMLRLAAWMSGIILLIGTVVSAGITSATASTAHAVSPTRATHSGMRSAATSRFPAARVKVWEPGRGIRMVAISQFSTTFLKAREAGKGTASYPATGQQEVLLSGEFCYNHGGPPWACLNSWDGGPWVKAYTAGPDGTDNNYFEVNLLSNGDLTIQDIAQNAWKGKCIGDAYNNSGRADTSLNPCATGWGTNFALVAGCPDNTIGFYDLHWKGYLGPPSGWVNGSVFYLNKPASAEGDPLYCFGDYP